MVVMATHDVITATATSQHHSNSDRRHVAFISIIYVKLWLDHHMLYHIHVVPHTITLHNRA